MSTTETLDVTKIEPRLKHPTIFKHFDALKGGQSFTIHNDHDPKPLYYQLLGERGKIFTWEYLQEGPNSWLVKITKEGQPETEDTTETIGSIAAKDYRKAEVFKKHGIDFCCGGHVTLRQAAKDAGLSEEQLRSELEGAETSTLSASQDYNKWGLDFLADYIKNTHHNYVRETAPVLIGIAEKVANAHGGAHPELFEVSKIVNELMEDLLDHLSKEEGLLFPNIKKLYEKKAEGDKTPLKGSLQVAIDSMHEEHDHAGEDLRKIRKLTNDYELPAGACNSYTYLFEKLKEFEDDLFRHIHLENNILFPKSIALQNS